MEYNSFYGGRQGAPFILAGRFKIIKEPDLTNQDEKNNIKKIIALDLDKEVSEITDSDILVWIDNYCMITNFKKGDAYKTIGYDEYVIIDAVIKNDPDNGKVFRRGRNYLQEDGNAIYIGQIVGPAGHAPHLLLDHYDDINEIETKTGDRKATGEYTVDDDDLLPGKYENGGIVYFNDEIKYIYCSIRDEQGVETTAYIGFKIPYPVIDFIINLEGSQPTPYDSAVIERLDDGNHPFYEKWGIKVPKGKKGDAFKNLKVFKPTTSVSYLDADGVSHVLEANREYLVYQAIDYTNSTPSIQNRYLGDYNMISNVTLDNNGTLEITFTNEDAKTFQNTIKWIDDVKGSAGYIKITFNNGDSASYIFTGSPNSTGALLAEEPASGDPEPEPSFAEGSPWFIEEIVPTSINKEISYIQGTGIQYINTKINPQDKIKFKAKIAFSSIRMTGNYIFGNDYNPNKIGIEVGGVDEKFTYHLANNGTQYNSFISNSDPAITRNTDYEIEVYWSNGNQYMKKNNVQIWNWNCSDSNVTIANESYLYLFNTNSTNISYKPCFMKLYYAQIYVNEELLRDFIPVLDNDNIPCLYDKVSGEFFYNQGTGEFLYE